MQVNITFHPIRNADGTARPRWNVEVHLNFGRGRVVVLPESVRPIVATVGPEHVLGPSQSATPTKQPTS